MAFPGIGLGGLEPEAVLGVLEEARRRSPAGGPAALHAMGEAAGRVQLYRK